MKSFDIPSHFSSSFIDEINDIRTSNDRLKKDFSPSLLAFGNIDILIPRHFGFCYGVKNAVEIAFKIIAENSIKKIFLRSEIIHIPAVNKSLASLGVQFIQDEKGNQMINPDSNIKLSSKGKIIVLGSRNALKQLNEMLF